MKKKWCKGFTLIEIMLVIALISILAFFGVPQMIQAKRNYTFSNDMRQMLTTINKARLEAIKLGTFTSVAFSPNPGGLPSYVAFVDTDRDGIQGPGETIIHQGTFHSGIAMNAPNFINNGLNGGNSMQFNSLGFPFGIDAAGALTNYSGTISVRFIDNSLYQRLTIAPNGRPTITKSRDQIGWF